MFELNGKDLATYLGEMIDPKFQAYPADDPGLTNAEYAAAIAKWNKEFVDWLGDVGRRLWDLLPEQFRDEYLRLQESDYPPRSILIHSDEMIFPWELVKPWSVANGYRQYAPLGVAHVLGRWQPGLRLRPEPQNMDVRKFVLMNPVYESNYLPWTTTESETLRALIPGAEVLKPVDLPAVQRMLDRSDVQIVHFSGHGKYHAGETADLSALLLEDGAVLPAVSVIGRPLGAAHPILYLNACSLGRMGIVVGHAAGFAANCLKGGWSGVVAPYWPVNDASAHRFSKSLYEKLGFGRSIGEALQELRAENPNDPTFQAYSYIGDPWARTIFS